MHYQASRVLASANAKNAYSGNAKVCLYWCQHYLTQMLTTVFDNFPTLTQSGERSIYLSLWCHPTMHETTPTARNMEYISPGSVDRGTVVRFFQ